MACTLSFYYTQNVVPFGPNPVSFAVPDGSYTTAYIYLLGATIDLGYEARSDGDAGTITLGGPFYPPATFEVSYTNFSNSCAAPTYDSINGTCVTSTTYTTPGHYPSLAACNAAITTTNCPAGQSCFDPTNLSFCPSCPPCASCPPGQTCQDSLGEEVNFVNISAPIFSGNCDEEGNPVFDSQSVAVISGTESSELLKFQELAQIKGAAVCNIDVAACPDGWLIRPEYHRPQAIYQFAEIDKDGKIIGAPKYRITVPHHVSDQPDDPLPNYKRGNWEIIYVLKDNSKVTIHSLNETVGMNLLDAIKLRITPSYLVGAYLSKSSLVVTDTDIAQITVKNRMAKYYSTGAKNDLPDWIAKW